MRAVTIILAAVLAAATTPPASRLQSLVDEARLKETLAFFAYRLPSGYWPAQQAVARAVESTSDAGAITAAVAESLGIPRRAAASLSEGVLLEQHFPQNLPGAMAAYREAAHAAPKSTAVVAAYVLFDIRESQPTAAEFIADLLPLLRGTSDPAGAALIVGRDNWSTPAMIALADALRTSPDDVRLLSAFDHEEREINAAFGPVSFDGTPALRAGWRGRAAQELAAAAAKQLTTLADLSLGTEMIAAYDTLPAETRRLLVERRADDPNIVDVAGELAAAFALAGNRTRAAELLKHVAPENIDGKIVADLLRTDRHDPFDVVTYSPLGIVGEATAAAAARGGYAQRAATLLDENAHTPYGRRTGSETIAPYLPAPLRNELRAMVARARTHRAALAAKSGVRSDVRILALLRQPATRAYVEQAMPADTATAPIASGCSGFPQMSQWSKLIRCESRGDERVAVDKSELLDPRGMWGSGYWIVHSRDGGKSWERLYTGIRTDAPYRVVESSTISMFGGDHLSLESDFLDTAPNDPWPSRRVLRRAMLSLSWEVLRRDSDGDGYTDLVEERMVTDPHAADSDGDGIDDAHDPLPQIVPPRIAPPEAEVMRAVMPKGVGRDGGAALIIGDRTIMAGVPSTASVIVLTREEAEAYAAKFGWTAFSDFSDVVIARDGQRAKVYLNFATSGNSYDLTRTPTGWIAKSNGGWVS